jgi:hypothetical protein
MENYFELVSQELLNQLNRIKVYVKKHNPTIGILTEEIVRSFLENHLPKIVSVEQGFILNSEGKLSKQCDIIIYNSQIYAPFYRINDVVIVPEESVIAVIEVKTTINKQIFHDVIDYFKSIYDVTLARKYLFIFNSKDINNINDYFDSYKHEGDYQYFDHDTFLMLPDEITGINESYHLKKDYVIVDNDSMGYTSYFYTDSQGTDINALEQFYLSICRLVEAHINNTKKVYGRANYYNRELAQIRVIELFNM